MREPPKHRLRWAAESALAMAPAIGAMYLLFWLERSGHWTINTPYRDVMTIACLLAGLGATFCLLTWFNRRRQ